MQDEVLISKFLNKVFQICVVFTCRAAARSTFDVGQKKHNVSFLLSFLPLCLEYFQLVLLYGYLWTCLDPSNHIWDNLDPGAKFWVHGPFGPKFKNCNFLTKHYNMGVYGLAWTPATIFKVIWTLGPNFLGPLAPNSKICNFLTKPYNMGIYGITWTSAFKLFEVIQTLGPNFGSKGSWAPN